MVFLRFDVAQRVKTPAHQVAIQAWQLTGTLHLSHPLEIYGEGQPKHVAYLLDSKGNLKRVRRPRHNTFLQSWHWIPIRHECFFCDHDLNSKLYRNWLWRFKNTTRMYLWWFSNSSSVQHDFDPPILALSEPDVGFQSTAECAAKAEVRTFSTWKGTVWYGKTSGPKGGGRKLCNGVLVFHWVEEAGSGMTVKNDGRW